MTGKRILIIDDEKWVCSLLGDYLGDSGYVIDSAGSIAEAKIKLSKDPLPDLVLSDVMLQDGNGLFYLKEVRGQARTKNLPIIIMSAVRAHSKDKVTGLEFGADDYVSKPFELKEIKLRIDNVLKRYYSPVSALPSPPSNPNPSEKKNEKDQSIESTLSHLLKANEPPKVQESSSGASNYSQIQDEPNIVIPLKTEVIDLIFNPKVFFDRWDDDSSWGFSIGLILLNGILWGIQNGIQEKSVGTGVISIISFVTGLIGIVSFIAWLIQWGFGLKNNPIPFRRTFGILGVALIPLSISAILGVIYVGASGGKFAEFTAGPLLIFPMQAAKSTLGFVMKRLDFFEIWAVILIGLGFSNVVKLRIKKTLISTFLGWIAIIGLMVIVRSLF